MQIRTLLNPASFLPNDESVNSAQAAHKWVMTIGNFDGVHLGHQLLLKQLQAQARQLNAKTAVCIFEPQPIEYFRPDVAPIRIMGARDKVEAIFKSGIDAVLFIRFNASLSNMSPKIFVQNLLGQFQIVGLTLGLDFRFGYKRQGDVQFLVKYGQEHGFAVQTMSDFTQDQQRVSSSLVREYLRQHDFQAVSKALGRSFQLVGRVKHGQKLARSLGYPTANLHIQRIRPPLQGVFVGRAYLPYNEPNGLAIAAQQAAHAVANCGYKPTVNGSEWQVEVHLFGLTQTGGELNLYGQRMAFEPLGFVRDEQKFNSVAELQSVIGQDVEQARLFFNTCK